MQTDIHSFIIRIWQEASPDDGREAVWRGSIEAVGNGPRAYFTNLQSMTHFIQEQFALMPGPQLSVWHRVWLQVWNGIRAIGKRL